MTWEELKKRIHGCVNKVNAENIKIIVVDLFKCNLVRGRGLFCRSIMRAQAQSLPFTPVFAALVAAINSKLFNVGELLLARLIKQFRRAYKRLDKTVLIATAAFIAHLCNHQVAHEVLPLQILVLLLERHTDDSVEVAVGIMREVGQHLQEISPRAFNSVFERFRTILHEASIDKRVQYMIEILFQVRKDKFKDNPTIPEGLDIVDEEDQVTHYLTLDEEVETHDALNVFKMDADYLEKEEKYNLIRNEILGSDSEGEEDEEEEGEEEAPAVVTDAKGGMVIHDKTGTDLVNLRRTIYLTIMSSLDFEEAGHKLLRLQLAPGDEVVVVDMVIDCCSQERTFMKFYGLLADRFAKMSKMWCDLFAEAFIKNYDNIHQLTREKIRLVATLFSFILGTDALPWSVFQCITITEDATTSSSRIFCKYLFQDLSEQMGVNAFNERLQDPMLEEFVQGLFPTDSPQNMRFAINFWTSIGLGPVTQGLRDYLKNRPKVVLSSESESQSESSASSRSPSPVVRKRPSLSPVQHHRRPSRSPSRRRSPPRRRYSRSPPPRSPPRRVISRSPPRRQYSRSPPRHVSRSPRPYRNHQRSRSPPRRMSRSPRRRYSRSPPRRMSRSPPQRR
jgi:pre-mRNA-splicing factor CWC22